MSVAQQDPVLAKSAFLSTYMSMHPETLEAYVKYALKQKNAEVKSCKIKQISSRRIDLSYQSSDGSTKETGIDFDPVLQAYDEVRPRLVQLKQTAEEYIGLNPTPQVDTFIVAPDYLISGLPMIFLIYCTMATGHDTFASTVRHYTGGWRTIYGAWLFVVVAHSLEGYIQFARCRRYKTGPINTFLWTTAVFCLGFPALGVFNKLAHKAKKQSAPILDKKGQ